MRKFALRAAICSCLVALSILPASAQSGTVQATSGLRLRSEASTSGSILTTMPNGSTLEILADMGNGWYQVSYGDRVGYSHGDYINIIEEIIVGSNEAVDGEAVEDASDEEAVSLGQQIADYAVQFVGCKYSYGGNGPTSFDCSGLVKYVMNHFDITVNRTASAQLSNGTAVSLADLQVGDAVYFKYSGSSTAASHTGIYIGDGQFVHASTYGVGVIISSLSESYYANSFIGGRRMI